MERRLILRGIAAGGLAGLLAALFTRIMAEPWIQKAIDYESTRDTMQDALRKAAGLGPSPPSGLTSSAAQPRATSERRSA